MSPFKQCRPALHTYYLAHVAHVTRAGKVVRLRQKLSDLTGAVTGIFGRKAEKDPAVARLDALKVAGACACPSSLTCMYQGFVSRPVSPQAHCHQHVAICFSKMHCRFFFMFLISNFPFHSLSFYREVAWCRCIKMQASSSTCAAYELGKAKVSCILLCRQTQSNSST